MSVLGKRYFSIQKLCFACLGIDPLAVDGRNIIKLPLLCYGTLLSCILHCVAIIHFVYAHINDYSDVVDALTLLCQSLLAIWKMIVFLGKRQDIIQYRRRIHLWNLQAKYDELLIIRSENAKDILICTIYFSCAMGASGLSLLRPILNTVVVYFKSGVVELREPHKATYLWDYSNLKGYSIVFLWNCSTVYFVTFASLSIDSMFSWLISNIMAKFRILFHRLQVTATTINGDYNKTEQMKLIIKCLQYHSDNLKLAAKLNQVYGAIILIKVLISCSQICCLVFGITRPETPLDVATYQGIFLMSVSVQLYLYCYNGQRIKGISMQVASEIYNVFDWYFLPNSCKKLLLVSMMRSEQYCELSGVFFTVDLSLYLWVFKTAGSLITALKTLEEKQD